MENKLTLLDTKLSTIFGSTDIIDKIITRGTDERLELKTLKEEHLQTIANFMPEVNRATNAFAKKQSQFMNYTMTVSSFSPIRNLRQILSEIEQKRMALKENIFNIKKKIIELYEKKELLQTENNKYKKLLLQVEIEELEAGISDSRIYIEASLKTILSYEQAYKDIKSNFNISDNWDEKDFELAEEEHHIMKAFQQAHADIISTGRITQGNHEYFWQCGINPHSALNDLLIYIKKEEIDIEKTGIIEHKLEINSFIEFLKLMANKYKGSSRKILESKGINPNGYYDNSLFKDLDI